MDASTNDLGELGEEVWKRGSEFIATEEPTVVAKFAFDAIVVKDCEGNGCLPNPPRADEGNRFELFCEDNDLFDQCVAPEKGLLCWGR